MHKPLQKCNYFTPYKERSMLYKCILINFISGVGRIIIIIKIDVFLLSDKQKNLYI